MSDEPDSSLAVAAAQGVGAGTYPTLMLLSPKPLRSTSTENFPSSVSSIIAAVFSMCHAT